MLLDTRLRSFQDTRLVPALVIGGPDLGKIGRVVLRPGDKRQGEEKE
jgi:hypothetical protein